METGGTLATLFIRKKKNQTKRNKRQQLAEIPTRFNHDSNVKAKKRVTPLLRAFPLSDLIQTKNG